MSCSCGKSYSVQSGDTLFIIAQRELGNGNRWREITTPNCTPFTQEEARRLQPGDEICLPNGSTPSPEPDKQINLEATFYASENVGCYFPATGVFGVTLRAALAGQLAPRCPGENVPAVQCAVAPSQIPLRTNFTLVLWDGRQVPAAALDTGTAILPGKIDILVDTVAEALDLGRKPVTVILSENGGGNRFTDIVSRQTYEAMFPNRNSLYAYDSLVTATQRYPNFCNEGSDTQRKREAAAFLANIAHETTGGWPTAPGGPYAWGLYYVEEVGCENGGCTQYCDGSNTTYPCVPGRTYHGRGPMQLSWNYNYGAVGQALGLDLLANPDQVKSDGAIAFSTALWFWMTPQPPKPSCHAVMSGGWTPSPDDANKGRTPGFGMTINIINGGLECSRPTNNKVTDRVGFYRRFCEMLGVSMGENLYCDRMQSYR